MPEHTIFITSPLEPENVARIRAAAGPRIAVIAEPELWPKQRYVADHVGEPSTRSAAQQRRWREALAAADIFWDLPREAADIAFAKWVQTTSTGVGQSVKKLGLQESDVVITTARGVHAGPLAEFVMMALLLHFRGLRHLDAEQKAQRWVRYCGEEAAGRTIAIVGAGDLARGIAKAARGFDMRVVAVARDKAKDRAHNALFDAVYGAAELHQALRQADAVVVTLPHTLETERMVDAAAFAAMKKGAAFVNIGRGQVIDEAALVENLQSGHLGFAALDVAEVEPLPQGHPLWSMPNVLISPHSASTVATENVKITEIFCYNLGCWLDGRIADMKNRLDKRLMY